MDFGAALRQYDKPQAEAVDRPNPGQFEVASEPSASDGTPTVRDPFDPAPLIELFDKFHGKIDAMETEAAAHQVTDDESCDRAIEMASQAKKLFQRVEKQRQKIKEPYLKVTRVLDRNTNPLKSRLGAIERGLNGKSLPYMMKKKQEQLEAERKAAEEAARMQAQIDAEAAETGETAPVVVAETISETRVQTETGAAKLKTEWDFEILDFRKLPDACLEARRAEIEKAVDPWVRAQIKAGLRKIEGVRVFEKVKLGIRVRR